LRRSHSPAPAKASTATPAAQGHQAVPLSVSAAASGGVALGSALAGASGGVVDGSGAGLASGVELAGGTGVGAAAAGLSGTSGTCGCARGVGAAAAGRGARWLAGAAVLPGLGWGSTIVGVVALGAGVIGLIAGVGAGLSSVGSVGPGTVGAIVWAGAGVPGCAWPWAAAVVNAAAATDTASRARRALRAVERMGITPRIAKPGLPLVIVSRQWPLGPDRVE
jgi:pilus assembly protein FimV